MIKNKAEGLLHAFFLSHTQNGFGDGVHQLKGHGNEADFLGFLQKLGPQRSLTSR